MNLNELKAKRGKIADQMQEMVNTISGDFTQEQDAQFKALSDEFKSLNNQIKRLESVESAQNTANGSTNPIRPVVQSGSSTNVPLNATDEYTNNFGLYLASNGKVYNDLHTGDDVKGGFLVPHDWEKSLIKELDDDVVMRRACSVITLNHNRHYPGIVDHGSAVYMGEKDDYNESDLTLNNKVLSAHKQGRIIKISDELNQDSAYNLPAEIRMSFQMTFGTSQEAAFTSGDGNGQPRGILLDAQDGATTVVAGSISHDDMLNLKYSLKGVYRNARSGWMMNSKTVRDLRKLKDANGQPLWQPSLQAGEPDMFDGNIVYINEQMPDIGSGLTPIIFGDFRHYKIADRLGIQLMILNELFATKGQIGMRFTARNDGRLMLESAVKKLTVQ